MRNKPAFKYKMGAVTGTVWRNEKDGKQWFSTQIQRSYKVGKNAIKNLEKRLNKKKPKIVQFPEFVHLEFKEPPENWRRKFAKPKHAAFRYEAHFKVIMMKKNLGNYWGSSKGTESVRISTKEMKEQARVSAIYNAMIQNGIMQKGDSGTVPADPRFVAEYIPGTGRYIANTSYKRAERYKY